MVTNVNHLWASAHQLDPREIPSRISCDDVTEFPAFNMKYTWSQASRWKTLLKHYIDPEAAIHWRNQIKRQPTKTATLSLMDSSLHSNGACLISVTYAGQRYKTRGEKSGTIILTSRVSLIGQMLPLDLALMTHLGRWVQEEVDIPLRGQLDLYRVYISPTRSAPAAFQPFEVHETTAKILHNLIHRYKKQDQNNWFLEQQNFLTHSRWRERWWVNQCGPDYYLNPDGSPRWTHKKNLVKKSPDMGIDDLITLAEFVGE